jgi:hypothetical protein
MCRSTRVRRRVSGVARHSAIERGASKSRDYSETTITIHKETPIMEQFDSEVAAQAPSSLAAILEPSEALAAAQRMQRWYRSTPQGAVHSQFGRDGRRVDARLALECATEDN